MSMPMPMSLSPHRSPPLTIDKKIDKKEGGAWSAIVGGRELVVVEEGERRRRVCEDGGGEVLL
jgi:hypothetical protein